MSDRHVLHPEVGKTVVSEFARLLNWPMVEDVERNRDENVDGLTEWELPNEISFFYCEDSDFGIPYFAFTGPHQRAVAPLVAQAQAALTPWKLDELFRKYDETNNDQELAETTLLVAIAAPNILHEGVFSRICTSMNSENENVRWVGVWSTTYTGYQEFLPHIQRMCESDPVDWVKRRAQSVLAAFNQVDGDQ
ncbi:HEAT repeat domain-containing protein [Streptomyces sp. NPDC059396]|uniref:HEAT repeat domain-containing protein n=1 Tax=Streptomyces sp. NPDC059396 TaxID=3346819 RepID=UPI0036BDBDF5